MLLLPPAQPLYALRRNPLQRKFAIASTRRRRAPRMSSGKEQLKKDWFILRSLVSKDFKLKYRRSVLGVLWSVFEPFAYDGGSYRSILYYFPFQHREFSVVFDLRLNAVCLRCRQ